MKAYKYTTTNANAIDNREILFTAPLELGDVLRLVNYHTRYEYSLQRVEVDSCMKVLTVREAMEKIDSIVLHKETRTFGMPVVDTVSFWGKCVSVDHVASKIEIDLSIGDFKDICKDPLKMLAENVTVHKVLEFCVTHNVKVTYNGSRAKISIPVWNGHQLLGVSPVESPVINLYYDTKFELKLREKKYNNSVLTEIEPMSK